MEYGHFSVSRVTNPHINYRQLPQGILNKFSYGEAQPRRPTPLGERVTFLHTIFDRKGTFFTIPAIPFISWLRGSGILRWLNTVLQAVSGNSRDGACSKFNRQTNMAEKKAMVHRREFLKICSLKLCDIFAEFLLLSYFQL